MGKGMAKGWVKGADKSGNEERRREEKRGEEKRKKEEEGRKEERGEEGRRLAPGLYFLAGFGGRARFLGAQQEGRTQNKEDAYLQAKSS